VAVEEVSASAIIIAGFQLEMHVKFQLFFPEDPYKLVVFVFLGCMCILCYFIFIFQVLITMLVMSFFVKW
jgi:hypothetical protein